MKLSFQYLIISVILLVNTVTFAYVGRNFWSEFKQVYRIHNPSIQKAINSGRMNHVPYKVVKVEEIQWTV